MEKESKNKQKISSGDASSNKVVRINERGAAANKVSWNHNTEYDILNKPGSLARLDNERTRSASLTHTKRQAHFLMEQLQSAKDELAAFRENHRSLLNQLFTVQKDYKNKIEAISNEKKLSDEEYKRLAASFRLKDKEFINTSKKLNELKDNYNKVQFLYSEKISKFKNQYKTKLTEREKEIETALTQLKFEKQQAQRRVDDLTKALTESNNEINALKAKCEEFSNTQGSLTESNRKKHEQAEKLNSKLHDYQKRFSSLTTAFELKKEEIEGLNSRIKSLGQENKEFGKKLQDSIIENRDIRVEANRKEIEFKNLEIENKTLRSVKDNRTELLETLNVYKFKERELLNDINNLKAELEGAHKELYRKTKEVDKYKRQVDVLEDEKSVARKAFEDSQAKLEARIDIINEQKTKLEDDNEFLGKEVESFKASLAEESKRYTEEKELNQSLSEKYEKALAESNENNLNFQQISGENKSISKKLVQAQTDVAEVKRDLANRNADVQELKERISEHEFVKAQLQDDQISLEMQVVQLSEELKSARQENHGNIDQISILTTKISALESDIDRVKTEKIGLEQKISNLNSVVETEQEKYLSLEDELAKSVDEVSAYKIREVEFVEREQNWKDAKDSLDFKIEKLEKDLESKENEIYESHQLGDGYLKQQKVLNEEINKLVQANESLVLKNKALAEDSDFDSQKYKDLVLEKNVLSAEIEEKALRISELKEQFGMQEEKEERLYKDIDALKKELADSIRDKKSIKDDFKKQISSLENKNKEFEKVVKSTKEGFLDLELKNQENLRTIKKYESNIIDEKEKVKELLDTVSVLKEEKDDLAQKLEGRIKKFNEMNYDFEKSGSEISVLADRLKEAQHQAQTLNRKNKELEKRIESKEQLNEEIKLVNKQKQSLEDEIEERQNQLNLYSRWVDSQKESLQSHVVRFAQELKASASVNPLKSYLALTEKEITKVQTALTKQKLMGPQRAYMEQHFDQLTQQKTYINELIMKSASDIEKRVSEVMGLLKQGEFIPVPPLPPKPNKK